MSMYRPTFSVLVLLALVFGTARLHAHSPATATVVFGMSGISVEQCRSRVSEALSAEGFGGFRDFGNGWIAATTVHSASVSCVRGLSETVVVITVAGDEPAVDVRNRLETRVRGRAAEPAVADVAGTWSVLQGSLSGTLTLRQSGSSLGGSIDWDGHADAIVERGTISGRRIELVLLYPNGVRGTYFATLDTTGTQLIDGVSTSSQGTNATWQGRRR